MHFLPDVYVPCDVCKGKRYNRETLEVKYKGQEHPRDPRDDGGRCPRVLRSGAGGGAQAADPDGRGPLLHPVRPVSHHPVGRRGAAGQAGAELSKRDTGQTLYILDEPTTGLHFHDIQQLLKVLHQLRDRGNTIVIIEHNLDVIKTADWIVDLGPEGRRRRSYPGDRHAGEMSRCKGISHGPFPGATVGQV